MKVSRRTSSIVWSGEKEDPTYDMCVKRPSGYWDIVRAVPGVRTYPRTEDDGWVLYAPVPIPESERTETDRFRRVFGDVPRDVVRDAANQLIRQQEGW